MFTSDQIQPCWAANIDQISIAKFNPLKHIEANRSQLKCQNLPKSSIPPASVDSVGLGPAEALEGNHVPVTCLSPMGGSQCGNSSMKPWLPGWCLHVFRGMGSCMENMYNVYIVFLMNLRLETHAILCFLESLATWHPLIRTSVIHVIKHKTWAEMIRTWGAQTSGKRERLRKWLSWALGISSVFFWLASYVLFIEHA